MDNNNKDKIKTREGSGYLKQLYSTARVNADSTHSGLKGLTTFLVNFIPVDKVDASELQVRTHFDDTEIEALAHSIKEHGVLQPILVVQDGDRYKVIAGERRLRATKQAGLERIPARVLSSTDKAIHEIALRENLDRVDLHPIEEGEGYVSLLDAKAYASHDTIAKAFGKPKSRITECIGFTRLPVATKTDLLMRGLKNRSLLRTLLSTPIEKHPDLVSQAAHHNEEGSDEFAAKGKVLKAGDKNSAAAKKSFSFIATDSTLKMPAFAWKKKDGNDSLQNFYAELKKLTEAVENLLTK